MRGQFCGKQCGLKPASNSKKARFCTKFFFYNYGLDPVSVLYPELEPEPKLFQSGTGTAKNHSGFTTFISPSLKQLKTIFLRFI